MNFYIIEILVVILSFGFFFILTTFITDGFKLSDNRPHKNVARRNISLLCLNYWNNINYNDISDLSYLTYEGGRQ
jgi:hypothetical protein